MDRCKSKSHPDLPTAGVGWNWWRQPARPACFEPTVMMNRGPESIGRHGNLNGSPRLEENHSSTQTVRVHVILTETSGVKGFPVSEYPTRAIP